MTPVRVGYARVRRRAEELLKDQARAPVDLETITKALGVEVRQFDLEPDISGILYREDGRRVIVVNQRHSPVRQRFTIAHEIAHLVLHKGESVHVDQAFLVNLRDPRSATAENVEEIEANAFAANLLMPAAWLRTELATDTIDLADEDELRTLAERYEVSTQAMAVRLASLFSD